MYNIWDLENNENYMYYDNMYNQKANNDYFQNNNLDIKKFNFKKFGKHKSSSLDRINIDNIYSLKNTQNNNNYNEEDLDIELDAISTKIPINEFYVDNNNENEKRAKNIYDYSDTRNNYTKKITNENNKNEFKTCTPSLIKKKRSKIQRHVSYDNLHTPRITDSNIKFNKEKKNNITNINITNNNMENNNFNWINEDLNNKTEYDFNRNPINKINNKSIIEDKINNVKIHENNLHTINAENDDDMGDEKYVSNYNEIKSDNKNYIDSYLLVELITKENNHNPYFLPINQYVIETFDGENGEILKENKYYLSSEERGSDQALIEISSPYSDIIIKFEESSIVNSTFYYFNGFHRYRVFSAKNDDVYFSVIKIGERKNTNYMIRYYYTGVGAEYLYSVDDLNKQVNITLSTNEYANVCITYDSLRIFQRINGTEYDIHRNDIYFYIYAFLFRKDTNSKELITF
jgi:hypothetical protein